MGKPAMPTTLKLVWENVGKHPCMDHLAWRGCCCTLLMLWKTSLEKMSELADKALSEKQFKHSCVTREVLNPLSDPECLDARAPTPEGRDVDEIKSRSVKALWEMLGMLGMLWIPSEGLEVFSGMKLFSWLHHLRRKEQKEAQRGKFLLFFNTWGSTSRAPSPWWHSVSWGWSSERGKSWNLALCISGKVHSLTAPSGVNLRLIHLSLTKPCSSASFWDVARFSIQAHTELWCQSQCSPFHEKDAAGIFLPVHMAACLCCSVINVFTVNCS